jgi:hypothetical protein
MKYTIIKNELSSLIQKEDKDGSLSFIPIDPANSDYQAYLEHEAAAK